MRYFMQDKSLISNVNDASIETLSSFIKKDCNVQISRNALFVGFKHRIKVEYLKSFVV